MVSSKVIALPQNETENGTHVCTIRLDRILTPSLNKYLRMHYRDTSKLRREYWLLVTCEARRILGVQKHRPVAHRRIRIVRMQPFESRTLDHDNLVGGCKPLVDALVDAGLIAGDSPEWVTIEYAQGLGNAAMIISLWETPTNVAPSSAHIEGSKTS